MSTQVWRGYIYTWKLAKSCGRARPKARHGSSGALWGIESFFAWKQVALAELWASCTAQQAALGTWGVISDSCQKSAGSVHAFFLGSGDGGGSCKTFVNVTPSRWEFPQQDFGSATVFGYWFRRSSLHAWRSQHGLGKGSEICSRLPWGTGGLALGSCTEPCQRRGSVCSRSV